MAGSLNDYIKTVLNAKYSESVKKPLGAEEIVRIVNAMGGSIEHVLNDRERIYERESTGDLFDWVEVANAFSEHLAAGRIKIVLKDGKTVRYVINWDVDMHARAEWLVSHFPGAHFHVEPRTGYVVLVSTKKVQGIVESRVVYESFEDFDQRVFTLIRRAQLRQRIRVLATENDL